MKSLILARGLGTRMRRQDAGVRLSAEQSAAADAGLKAMMPIERGRPFLHYVLSALADAGIHEICIVIGPDDFHIQRHFHHKLTLSRLRIAIAVQEEPKGTADAVLAGESFAKGDRFLVLNADNYYPVSAYRALASLAGAGVAGFDRHALVTQGNIDSERIRKYALLRTGADNLLDDIIEKPDEATFTAMGEHALVSMNLWAFTDPIFEACRRVKPSSRGELELPDAVRIAKNELGVPFTVVPMAAPVLDLGSRSDIAPVAAALSRVAVRL